MIQDQYLNAIQKEEQKYKLLEDKKVSLVWQERKKRDQYRTMILKKDQMDLDIRREEKRKDYLFHKKKHMKYFIRQSLIFAIAETVVMLCGFFFLQIVPLLLRSPLFISSFSQLAVMAGVCMAGLSVVNFGFLSKEYFQLTWKYRGNVQKTLNDLYSKREQLLERQKKLYQNLEQYKQLQQEVNMSLTLVADNITQLRSNRNRILSAVVKEITLPSLDFHYVESDIEPVMNKIYIYQKKDSMTDQSH